MHSDMVKAEQGVTSLCSTDQGRVLMAWHGDANHVAVSYVEAHSRRFCVFDQDGELISCLQHTDTVEEALAYRPTGNLIATSAVRDGFRHIVLHERNGQRRSEFELGPCELGSVIEWMGWNTDGNILAVRLRNERFTEQGIDQY
ncbi:unnamed protein product [Gongylonema pulchrum]|uniref:ANAPC4_WD40 domain-containing protein n=1 Tax=Gongylonema pulchrum TaxID=637853 RepID=A0A183E478_9BILA|nr:unnamed protein product [Gongylonema pulchrum]